MKPDIHPIIWAAAVAMLALAGCKESVDWTLPQFPYRSDCERYAGECEKRWRGDVPFYQPARRAP